MKAHFSETEAFKVLEAIMWPDGAVARLGKLENQRTKANKKNREGKLIHGLWKCYHCKGKFIVRVCTIFEGPLHRYLAEFDFHYNNRVALGVDDMSRTMKALTGARGKHLMYRDS